MGMTTLAGVRDSEDHRRGYAVLAFLLALLLQGLLLWLVAGVRISFWQEAPAAPPPGIQVDRLTVAEMLTPPVTALPQPPEWRTLPEPVPSSASDDPLAGALLPMRPAERLAMIEGLGKNILDPPSPLPHDPPPFVPPTSPSPVILAVDGATDDPSRASHDRLVIPDIPRVSWGDKYSPSLTSLNPSGGGGGGVERIGLGGMKTDFRAGLPDLNPPPIQMPPPQVPPPLPDTPTLPADTAFLPPVIDASDEAPPGDLNPLMQVELTVYQDPETGGGVYRLRITANEKSDRLVALPRDVLLLLDASASITADRLRESLTGLDRGLDTLSARDRFNFVVFRERPEAMFPEFVAASAANKDAVRKFMGTLRSRGSTDVFGSLTPWLTLPRTAAEQRRPYLVFLVSDGVSTTGERPETNEFLRRVSVGNEAGAAIFTYLTGGRRDRFLLEFLAYRSRGYAMQAPELLGRHELLTRFLDRLKEVIVADPVCRMAGGLDSELYPRALPHLFRAQPLVLHGRFPPGTTELHMQIEGRNSEGGRESLLITRGLHEAIPAGPELETEWATQKIYHLLGERAVRGTPEFRRDIERLSQTYKILVPY